MSSMFPADLEHLATGPLHWFRDWPNPSIPNYGAGTYTIWNAEGALIYVGMSGRGMNDDTPKSNRQKGLVTRLRAHAMGKLSGDQFCVYVAERFVLAKLRERDIEDIAAGRHSIDSHVRRYIHENLGYRFVTCRDGSSAMALERVIQRGEWPSGTPLLNPRRPPRHKAGIQGPSQAR